MRIAFIIYEFAVPGTVIALLGAMQIVYARQVCQLIVTAFSFSPKPIRGLARVFYFGASIERVDSRLIWYTRIVGFAALLAGLIFILVGTLLPAIGWIVPSSVK